MMVVFFWGIQEYKRVDEVGKKIGSSTTERK